MTDPTRDGAEAPGAGEEAAWAGLRARWGDEEAHRALLAGVNDLEGLARVGARYREVLVERPDDAAGAPGTGRGAAQGHRPRPGRRAANRAPGGPCHPG